MFQQSKKVKAILTAIIVIGIVGAGIASVKFQSADSYKKEQQSLAESNISSSSKAEAQATAKEPTETVNKEQQPSTQIQADNNYESKADNELQQAESNLAKTQTEAQAEIQAEAQSVIQSEAQAEINAETQSEIKSETEEEKPQEKYVTCTFSIRCDEAASNKDTIKNEGIAQLIPDSGVMQEQTSYTVKEGTTVYDLLKMSGADIAANSGGTYITSINGLAEKMAGVRSGWTYRVNEKLIMLPASYYKVAEGDNIVWWYVCGQ